MKLCCTFLTFALFFGVSTGSALAQASLAGATRLLVFGVAFNKDGTLLPWLVHGMRYVEPDQGMPYVVVDMLANTMQSANSELTDHHMRRSGMTTALVVNRHDIVNRTIPEMLAEFGFYKECPEFKLEYERHAQRFLKHQPRFGAQLRA